MIRNPMQAIGVAKRAPSGGVRPAASVAPITTSPFQRASDAYLAAAQPDLMKLQLQNNTFNRNMGFAYQGQGLQRTQLQDDYNSQLGDVNTRLGQNAIDIAGADRQIPYYDTLMGLADQMLGSQMRDFGVQEDQSRLGARKENAANLSDATSRGAMTAPGTGQQRGFIEEGLTNSLRSIMEGKNQATISNTREKTTLEENKAKARDQKAQLEMEAQNLGQKPEQLRRSLENGLAQLGLHTMMTVDDLMDGLAQNNLQAMAIKNAALQQGGMYATAMGKIYG